MMEHGEFPARTLSANENFVLRGAQACAQGVSSPVAVARQLDHLRPEPWPQDSEPCKSSLRESAVGIHELLYRGEFKADCVGDNLRSRKGNSVGLGRPSDGSGFHVHSLSIVRFPELRFLLRARD